MRQLAVDLGTSSTVAVLVEPGRAPRILEIEGSSSMPSSVFLDEQGACTLDVVREIATSVRPLPG